MRYVLALAALPAAVMWAATPSSSPPVVARVVQSESIREQRQDDNTFRLRWSPVSDMPPTIEVYAREHGWQDLAGKASSSTDRGDGSMSVPATHQTRTRRASLRTDICARYGMRKVMVGRYKWRCRR